MSDPLQGEVWWVHFDPVIGSEIEKTRPAVVISRDAESGMGLRLVIPLTTWRDAFARHRSKVRIDRTPGNGLRSVSAADAMQCRGVSTRRFDRQLGAVEDVDLDRIGTAIQFVIARRQ